MKRLVCLSSVPLGSHTGDVGKFVFTEALQLTDKQGMRAFRYHRSVS